MRLKSFSAKTMTEAMQMVRETLGDDAVIVATREERGGRGVNVTAAIDPDTYVSDPAFELSKEGRPAPAEDWLQYDDEEEEFAIAEELTETLLRHGTPEDVMDNILSCATVVGLDSAEISLIAAIEHLFHFRPLPTHRHKKAILMAGASGAGKTLAIAKLAARGTMDGLNIGVISTDTVRAGGVEQLGAFTQLLNIDLKTAETAQDLRHAIDDLRGHDQILIDTSGTNPFDKDDIKMLAKLIGCDDIEPYLIMQAGLDPDESGEMARAFASVGIHTLIPTRVDVARRLGGILSAAHQGSMSFAEASATPKVADGLRSLTPQVLAKLLMRGSYSEAAPQHVRRTGTRQ